MSRKFGFGYQIGRSLISVMHFSYSYQDKIVEFLLPLYSTLIILPYHNILSVIVHDNSNILSTSFSSTTLLRFFSILYKMFLSGNLV